MKFLVLVQDLRVSGTSEGIVSRSFLAKLRKIYPEAYIEVHYIIHTDTEDKLDLLPVNAITKHLVNSKIPAYVTFLNRFYWRLFHTSLKERYIQKQFANYIKKIDYKAFDNILVRSAGINHEMILALKDLPILKKAIINFHDPYPLTWYYGGKTKVSALELFRLKQMMNIVQQVHGITSSAQCMAHDLQQLYAYNKKIFTLTHQYDASVFDWSDRNPIRKKERNISISYHGALMFGRNIKNVLWAYEELLLENPKYVELTEFILRLRGDGIANLKEQFRNTENIKILDCLNFVSSAQEQIQESDIVLILENGPLYCNTLVGKAPFLAANEKPVLCISPEKSELRNIIQDERCIADMNNKNEIKEKLKNLIENRLVASEQFFPFGNYFSEQNFMKQVKDVIQSN
ncbi:hypothetical protein ACFS5J_03160 [Flavobacterium chuncheonense]|uniref:Glycosyltransferase n=1 Tax=Flavobacterium chuncheonense TaxID=2026653 RepID=A0ABW5YJ51_9FLAO